MRVLIDTNILADFIVTRNIKDFVTSRVPAILPDEFLKNITSTKFR